MTLGKEQAALLRTSRRWHVISLTLFFIVMINVLPFFETVWLRLRASNLVLIAIVAFGEIIEMAFRWHRRTRMANSERVVAFVLKVGAICVYKFYLPSITFVFARAHGPPCAQSRQPSTRNSEWLMSDGPDLPRQASASAGALPGLAVKSTSAWIALACSLVCVQICHSSSARKRGARVNVSTVLGERARGWTHRSMNSHG